MCLAKQSVYSRHNLSKRYKFHKFLREIFTDGDRTKRGKIILNISMMTTRNSPKNPVS